MYLLRAWYISLIITKFTFKMASFFFTLFLQMGVLKKLRMIKLTTFTVIPAPARSTGTNVGRNTLSSILTGGRAFRWKTVKKLYRQLNNEQSLAWQKRSRLGKKEQRILWNNSCSWRKMFVDFVGHPYPRIYAAKLRAHEPATFLQATNIGPHE